MSTATACRPIDQAWEGTKRLVYQQIWWFVKRFGGDFDDYLGPAHEAWMRAFESHDPERGKFTTLLWWTVRNELSSYVQQRSKQRARESANGSTLRHLVQGTGFDLETFCGDLSDDASTVVELLLDGWQLSGLGQRNGWGVGDVLADLRTRLGRMGWNRWRITETFSELREVVHS